MANARDRKRRPGRRGPFRKVKKRILVVTEGKVTEKEYLKGFERSYRNALIEINVISASGNPRTYVEQGKKHKDRAKRLKSQDVNQDYDAVWCVFDIDEHHKDYQGVADAVRMAQRNNVQLAISNPCFELWLLLHFRENPGQKGREKMKAMLVKHVPDYDKHVDYDATYAAGYNDAVARAKKMEDDAEAAGESYRRNPTTGVHRLTELIRG